MAIKIENRLFQIETEHTSYQMKVDKYYKEAVGGVHILPFFPSSADRGFAPMCYDKVDEAFGNYNDIEKIGKDYY